jgi:REP element-mobilizing transposase RayT
MPRRSLSESGYYHVVVRSAGKVALFEDDADRRCYLRLLKEAREKTGARIIAWVLMTNHVHLVVDFGESSSAISAFMSKVNWSYSKYFNARTGREGTLFQGGFWSKPIADDAQLIATVYYVHMNPETAGIAPMREYHWSSYQEYAGTHWVVDTSVLLGYFGSFEAFDAYEGSPRDVVWDATRLDNDTRLQDEDALALAMRLAGVKTSSELRGIHRPKRDEIIHLMSNHGVSGKTIARTWGLGTSTVSRILRRD